MVSRTDIIDALTMCSGYDPGHFSQPSRIIVAAWEDHLGQYPGVARDDLLEAVRVYYRTPDRRVPQPADISKIARDLRKSRLDTETDHEKNLRIAANEERLGLPLEDRTFPNGVPSETELLALTSSEDRRKAIEHFARTMASKAVPPPLEIVAGQKAPKTLDDPVAIRLQEAERARQLAALEALPEYQDPPEGEIGQENGVPAAKRVP